MDRWRDGTWWLIHLWSAPKPDFGPPFSGRRLLVGAHQGAIEHETVVIGVRGQGGEYAFPDAGLGPARETLARGLPFAIALGQISSSAALRRSPDA